MSIDSLRPLIRRLARTAEENAFGWMVKYNPGPDQLAEDLQPMLAVYTQSAAILTADWYNDVEADSRYHARPEEEIATDRLLAAAEWIYRGPQLPENRARQMAHAIVFDSARQTVLINAQREGVAVARQERASACTDCVARSTVERRSKSGGRDDGDWVFHPHCDGMFVPVRKDGWEPPDHARGWAARIRAARRAGNVTADDIASWLTGH